MVTKARIENGVVAEILTADPFPPFHADLVWIECAAGVTEGDVFDGAAFSKPTESPDQLKEKRIAQIKAELLALDQKKIRPLAEGDVDFLATLNAQTAALRAELVAM